MIGSPLPRAQDLPDGLYNAIAFPSHPATLRPVVKEIATLPAVARHALRGRLQSAPRRPVERLSNDVTRFSPWLPDHARFALLQSQMTTVALTISMPRKSRVEMLFSKVGRGTARIAKRRSAKQCSSIVPKEPPFFGKPTSPRSQHYFPLKQTKPASC